MPNFELETLASGSDDHTIKIWKVDISLSPAPRSPGGSALPTAGTGKTGHPARLANLALKLWWLGVLVLGLWWLFKPGPVMSTLTGHTDDVRSVANVHSVAFSPDGTLLASGSDDRTIKIWKVDIAR